MITFVKLVILVIYLFFYFCLRSFGTMYNPFMSMLTVTLVHTDVTFMLIKWQQQKNVEKETRRQSINSSWFKARELRLTASRFCEIRRVTYSRNIDKLCNSG